MPFAKKLLLFICCAAFLHSQGQELTINVSNKPLNKVLVELKINHNIQFSFNDQLLANCKVTLNKTFSSVEKAIAALVRKCDLDYELSGEVFILFKQDAKELPNANKKIHISGRIVDKQTHESLPFTTIQINNSGLVADVNGAFSFTTKDSTLKLTVSHVGYYLEDTIVQGSANITLALVPQAVGLREVVIKASSRRSITPSVGSKSGLLKLNQNLVSFLAGNSDNTIFNLLRLQPGVMAAGEQTKDFTIWGSYKGQSQVIFDGITLFSLSSENDNIGAVNPLMVKDVEVNKGGYNAHIGDRVGGLVNITGTNGDQTAPHATIRINNQTVAGLLSVPVSSNSALQVAIRKNYELPSMVTATEKEVKTHDFGDLNLKFSGQTKGGNNYYISLLGSKDNLLRQINEVALEETYSSNNTIDRIQAGGAMGYVKKWKRAGATSLIMAYSSLQSTFSNTLNFLKDSSEIFTNNTTNNSISELSFKTEHRFNATKHHSLKIGAGVIHNTAGFSQDSLNSILKSNVSNATRIGVYAVEELRFARIITLQPGLRIDLPLQIGKPFSQPRINATIQPAQRFRINLAWGIYNQFISENELVDQFGNLLYFWDINNDYNLTVLNGMHSVAGFSFAGKMLELSAEGFYKTTNGLSRYVADDTQITLHTGGEAVAYGVDLYMKLKIKKHELWAAYTLSRTEEYFPKIDKSNAPAPQDQTHEIKAAGLLSLHPFYISANYVYGSGFGNGSEVKMVNSNQPYSRLDLAGLYRFNTLRLNVEVGISILNVTDNKNIRYNSFSAFPDNKTTYYTATPFTPTVFLNIGF